MGKVWFITGSSRGFGRLFAEAALARGDKVAATARKLESLADLKEKYGDSVLPLALDVTDRQASFDTVGQAQAHFGRIDVLVNNAGYGHFGHIEEISEEEARSQMETNVFGALWVTQAALPFMREQGSGHIVQISSVGGIVAFPSLGMYHASKWALEGFSESLAQEVAAFGIKVSIVEPSGFSTEWGNNSAVHSQPLPVYDGSRKALEEAFANATVGDPAGAARELLKVVDAENPPLRVFFGQMAYDYGTAVTEQRLKTWADWEKVSRAADSA